MSLTAIRDAIYNKVNGVSGIEKVHKYRRWTTRFEEYLNFYKDSSNIINGWQIHRRSTAEIRETTGPRFVRMYDMEIDGYFGLHDTGVPATTSAILFDNLIELICTAFKADPTLGGAAQKHDLIQVESVIEMMFSDALVHYCELSLLVYEELNS